MVECFLMEEVIKKAQKGDKSAFEELYKYFYKKIYRYCGFNIRKDDVAQDICQETFLRAWRFLPSFCPKNGGTFQAFLFKIARNLIIDFARKKKEVPIEEAENVESKEDLVEEFDKKINAEKLKKALLQLEDIDRQIILLRYFEEMASIEVARIIGIRDGALRVRTHRVLEKLKVILEGYGK